MDKSLHQVESLPESFIPGGVYFDKETGGVYVAQDSSTKKQFGGGVIDISEPQAAGSFTASNPGVNAVQKVSDTSSKGKFDVITSIVYINGAKLIAMGDGDTISYGGSLFSFLQANMKKGKLFMLSIEDHGSVGFGGRPVVVESLGSTYVISLVSHGTPYNKIIRWTVTNSNQVTRNDTVLTSTGSGGSAPADIIIDESLLKESSGPASEEPELVTLLKPYIQAVNSGTAQIPKLFVKKQSAAGDGTTDLMLYPASFQGNTGELDGQFIMYPGILSYYGSGDGGVMLKFYGVTIVYASSTLVIQKSTFFQLPHSDGSDSLVLAQNGTWRSLPSSVIVDSALSSTSTNPVQNKVVKAELDKKLDKAGGTLTGPIQYPTNAGASSSKYYIGVGSGHQVSTGKRGLKILSYEDYNNSAHGIGCDLHHPSNDMSFAMTTGSSSDIGYFTFSRVNRNSDDYELVAEIRTDGTIYAGGKKCVTEDELPERGTVVFFSSGMSVSVAGKGLRVAKSSLKPTGITPVVGKDIVIQVNVGVIGLITSSDVQNYYLSYDNGTLLECTINQ